MVAVRNSMKRSAARSPASAMTAGTMGPPVGAGVISAGIRSGGEVAISSVPMRAVLPRNWRWIKGIIQRQIEGRGQGANGWVQVLGRKGGRYGGNAATILVNAGHEFGRLCTSQLVLLEQGLGNRLDLAPP